MRRSTAPMSIATGQDYAGTGTAERPRTGIIRTPEPGMERLRRTLVDSSLTAPLRRTWSGLGTSLMYHRVCAEDSRPDGRFAPNHELMVREGEFDAQMRHLAANYNCLALPDAVRLLQSRMLPKRSVVVTFDDGYLDNLTLALPILRAYGVPATIYVTTGIVENTTNLWWYELESIINCEERLHYRWNGKCRTEITIGHRRKLACFNRLSQMLKRMTPVNQNRLLDQLRNGSGTPPFSYRRHVLDCNQVRELADDPLITIGAHTHHHSVLRRLNDSQVRREVEVSQKLLEAWTGRSIAHLAYPFGGRDQAGRREFRIAEEMGFASAVTTRTGHLHSFHATQLHALPRIAIGHSDTMTSFRWKLSGLECLMRRPLARILN